MNELCQRLLPLLHDWIEGMGDEEDRMLARCHYEVCPHCRKVVDEWRALGPFLKDSVLSLEQTLIRGKEEPVVLRASPVVEVAVTTVLSTLGIAFSVYFLGAVGTSLLLKWSLWLSGAGPWLDLIWDIAYRFA
ncbi:MAG: hypothetical protein NZ959_05710 [Armatimonadetes bacterium]|nr:hypothetical protein [Armatimonadota bacterium]MDW8122422.1 hypothetical protein [Armatimonadota bacterium]